MEVNDGLLTCVGFEEGEVIGIGHEEILREDSWAEGVAEDIEIFFPVGVAVGIVCTDAPAWEVFYCCLAEAVG